MTVRVEDFQGSPTSCCLVHTTLLRGPLEGPTPGSWETPPTSVPGGWVPGTRVTHRHGRLPHPQILDPTAVSSNSRSPPGHRSRRVGPPTRDTPSVTSSTPQTASGPPAGGTGTRGRTSRTPGGDVLSSVHHPATRGDGGVPRGSGDHGGMRHRVGAVPGAGPTRASTRPPRTGRRRGPS